MGAWLAVPVALDPRSAYNAPSTAELESSTRHVVVIPLEKCDFC